MSAFADAAAALHASDDLAVAALYTPPGEDAEAVPCRVILAERDAGDGGMMTRETTAAVLLAELAAPVEGALLAVGGKTWRVRAVERDIEGVTATLTLRG